MDLEGVGSQSIRKTIKKGGTTVDGRNPAPVEVVCFSDC